VIKKNWQRVGDSNPCTELIQMIFPAAQEISGRDASAPINVRNAGYVALKLGADSRNCRHLRSPKITDSQRDQQPTRLVGQ
jgi:hypothetical protein